MKEEFKEKIEELNRIGIIRVCTDIYQRPNNRLYVKSPVTRDKHNSLKLYPVSNSFCDYANGNKGGDIIRLVSYVKNIDNWQALKLLKDIYGLSDFKEEERSEAIKKIRREQQAEKKRKERKNAFGDAVIACIEDLKQMEGNYTKILENGLCEPYSEVWQYIIEQLQTISYKLDILCASDMAAYRIMKSKSEKLLLSDRPKWILDVLKILKEQDFFIATQEEIQSFKVQCSFSSGTGVDGGCMVAW